MNNREKNDSIILKVNDMVIPMNHFVESVFINVINGLVEALDKTPEEKKIIEILLKKN